MKLLLSCRNRAYGTGILLLWIAVSPVRAQTGDVQTPDSNLSVDWKSLFWQSSISLGLMNGFRVATEPGTRDALKGPFFGDYFRALGNLHGWSDGDEFYVSYIGHPMEGATSGFIFVQNDGKYQGVEFGRRATYWKSRLRAGAFAWAYSEQFEIGPASEASLGNIQSYYPAHGFVDHVVTPVIGLGWIVAEDALDRYVVKSIESRTSNVLVRLMARTWLNPSRSYANLMAFRRPWHRNTRPGVRQYDPGTWQMAQTRAQRSSGQEDVTARAFMAQPGRRKGFETGGQRFKIPTFELAAHYDFFHNRPTDSRSGSCNGGGATGTFALNHWVGAVIDVSGCKMPSSDSNVNSQSLTYLFGPRFTYRKGDRWSLYLHVLVGGQKLNQERILPERMPTGDLTEWNKLDTWIRHDQIAEASEANGFAMSVGGGLDLSVNRALAIRVGSMDHLWSTVGDFNGVSYSRGLRFSSGAVLRLGNW